MHRNFTRKKKFSEKVKTGCLTCKRRRVKCDELKPECFICIRGGHKCLGYDPSAVPPKAKDYVPPDGYLELGTELIKRSGQCDFVSSVQCAPPGDFVVTIGTAEEQHALGHWLRNAAPMLSLYGAAPEVHNKIIPQLAWQFPAIKHLLVAFAVMHEKFSLPITAESTTMTKRAITHYSKAITELTTKRPPPLVVLLASMLAWELEMTQNNFGAATMHVQAMTNLLPSLQNDASGNLTQTSFEELSKQISETVGFCKGFHEVCLSKEVVGEIEPEYQDHLYAPWFGISSNSTSEAKTYIVGCIEDLKAIPNDGDLDLKYRQICGRLSRFADTVRQWSQVRSLTPEFMAVLHLFNITMALLPPDLSYGFSYENNPGVIDGVLNDVRRLMEEYGNDRSKEIRVELEDSLTTVLLFIMKLFPRNGHSQRATSCLQKLRSLQLVKVHLLDEVVASK